MQRQNKADKEETSPKNFPEFLLCKLKKRAPHPGTRVNSAKNKSARRDSNPRPRPWQGRAPPTEPLAHM